MKKEYTLKLGIAAKKPFQNSGLPLKSMECPITTRNENKNGSISNLGEENKNDNFGKC